MLVLSVRDKHDKLLPPGRNVLNSLISFARVTSIIGLREKQQASFMVLQSPTDAYRCYFRQGVHKIY